MKPILLLQAAWFSPQDIDKELVAVRFQLREGWHIYFENPGDTGMQTSIVDAEEVFFPSPKRIPLPGDLLSYGYAGEVVFFATGFERNSALMVRWLACKDDTCIPGKKTLEILKKAEEDIPTIWSNRPRECRFSIKHESQQLSFPSQEESFLIPFLGTEAYIQDIGIQNKQHVVLWKSRPKHGRLFWVHPNHSRSCLISW